MFSVERDIAFGLENLGIDITFDLLNGFLSLDPKNEALELLSRFLTFKYEIIFPNKNISEHEYIIFLNKKGLETAPFLYTKL